MEVAPSPKLQRTVTASPSGSVAVPANATDPPGAIVTLAAGAVIVPFGALLVAVEEGTICPRTSPAGWPRVGTFR